MYVITVADISHAGSCELSNVLSGYHTHALSLQKIALDGNRKTASTRTPRYDSKNIVR